MVMAGLLDTFRAVPPGSAGMPGAAAETFVALAAQSFSLGIRWCAPVLASLLVANLALGLISRTLPQLNVLAVGLGMNILLTAGVLALAIGGGIWVFQDQLEPAVQKLAEALAGGGG
jgi:flagellar biosynthetic protein FliR